MQDRNAQGSNRAEYVPRCLQDVFVDRLTDADRLMRLIIQDSAALDQIMREFPEGIARESDASNELLQDFFNVFLPVIEIRGKEGVEPVEMPEFVGFDSEGEFVPARRLGRKNPRRPVRVFVQSQQDGTAHLIVSPVIESCLHRRFKVGAGAPAVAVGQFGQTDEKMTFRQIESRRPHGGKQFRLARRGIA